MHSIVDALSCHERPTPQKTDICWHRRNVLRLRTEWHAGAQSGETVELIVLVVLIVLIETDETDETVERAGWRPWHAPHLGTRRTWHEPHLTTRPNGSARPTPGLNPSPSGARERHSSRR